MAQEEEVPITELSGEFTEDNGDTTKGVKQFSDCDCDTPIVEPLSYVLPDQQFISLLYCKVCNGLCRYSITELPSSDDEDASEEEVEATESLLEDIDALKTENDRLQQKLRRQSRRMRMTQDPVMGGSETTVVPPNSVSEDHTDESGENQSPTVSPRADPSKQNISPTARKALFATLILGVGLTGAVIWNSSALSALGIAAGTLLIIIPIYVLTDGEIPQTTRE